MSRVMRESAPARVENGTTRKVAIAERGVLRERVVAALRGELAPAAAPRLAALAERFGLGALETDLLAVLWVGAFDPELRAQIASREPYAGQVTVRLIATLFGHDARVRLPSESPLLLWQMAQEHPLIDGTAALTLEPVVLAWLEGKSELDRLLAGRAALLPAGGELPSWPIDAIASRLRDAAGNGRRCRLHLHTADAVAARWFAAAVGARLGVPMLHVPGGALSESSTADAALRLHRQAFLDGCVPCVSDADAVLASPGSVPPYPLQVVHGVAALVPVAGVQDIDCELAPPDAAEREHLWRTLWPESAAWQPAALSDLALRHDVGVADIDAVAAGRPASAEEAAARLRERSRADAGPMVRRVEARFEWNDLVLPEPVHERLRELAFEARERARVWSEPRAARLYPYGRGLVALFHGSPGTGKTMAAQVIAADLGLDLLSVDVSAVLSKWVGETAQHLQQLLSSPAAQRAVLFFDEADAIYGKRVEETRDAQDRYANLDTSYLMTALEQYPGIVLMATNLKANIDPAFVRRIRHVIDFPKPGPAARLRIWQQVLQALFNAPQLRAVEPLLPRIASLEATGAVIKNAALSALFAARRLQCEPDLALLGSMLGRELAKEGAGLSPNELAQVLEGGR